MQGTLKSALSDQCKSVQRLVLQSQSGLEPVEEQLQGSLGPLSERPSQVGLRAKSINTVSDTQSDT
eukprot:364905-Chlamydomonas_euryale.AAC.2